jgi:tetratricopeptide (TPR) repeat protein
MTLEAYRSTFRVYTKQAHMQDWATAHKFIGNTLFNQALSVGEPKSIQLQADALEAYRHALEFFTHNTFANEWADIEWAISSVHVLQGNFLQATKDLEDILLAFPNSTETVERLATLYHDRVIRLDRARLLAERSVELDPSWGNRMNAIEAELTDQKYSTCLEQAAQVKDDAIPPAQIAIRDILKMACQWGASNKTEALKIDAALLPRSAKFEKTGWETKGDRQFLATASEFAPGRAAWIALFESIETGDGAAMAKALRELASVMEK